MPTPHVELFARHHFTAKRQILPIRICAKICNRKPSSNQCQSKGAHPNVQDVSCVS